MSGYDSQNNLIGENRPLFFLEQVCWVSDDNG